MQKSATTLVWTDYTSWNDIILELISDYVNHEVIDSFRTDPPKYVVSDNTGWLDRIVHRVRGFEVDVKHELACLLTERFDTFRTFHGCCPLDTNSYYKQGIRRLDLQEYEQIAKDHFLSGRFPELSESDVLAAVEDMESDNRAGKVFFEANEKMLLECCGHYMLYGSEYLLGIAATLSRRDGPDYRKSLKGIGVPTVFVCNVPFDSIAFDTILELSGSMIEVMFEKFLDSTYKHPQPGDCFGFPIRKNLPPEYIVGHYHPEYIRDPIC